MAQRAATRGAWYSPSGRAQTRIGGWVTPRSTMYIPVTSLSAGGTVRGEVLLHVRAVCLGVDEDAAATWLSHMNSWPLPFVPVAP